MEITLERLSHRGQECLAVKFKYDTEVFKLLKKIEGGRWSKTHRAWLLNYSQATLDEVLTVLTASNSIILKGDATGAAPSLTKTEKRPHRALPELNEEAQFKIHEFQNWMRSKRYSDNTISTYCDALRTFLRYYSYKAISELRNADVIHFNIEYILKNKLSASFQNQVVNSIKLFFKTVELTSLSPELVYRPQRQHALPNVLSKHEVELILKNTRNLKHKTALSLIYSCGLRRSELLNLKLTDVNSDRKLLIIKMAKGNKDRVAPLSQRMIDLLREYYLAFRPNVFLFEGWVKGERYSEKSLQQVLKNSVNLAKLNKPISLHWLRHSYATHLLEKGTDLRYIQEILGHKSSRTTEIYTHVSNKEISRIVSPFDDLQL